MILTTLTLPELQAMTKAQITTAVKDYLIATYTRKQLIAGIVGQEQSTEIVTRQHFADGQIDKTVVVTKDIETGTVLSKVVTNWTYYDTPKREVHKIITRYLDPVDGELGRITRTHYRDGRQPTVETSGVIPTGGAIVKTV